MLRLKCNTQSYEWGSLNEDCIVGKFSRIHSSDTYPPYAEFLMGCGQSVIENTNQPLYKSLDGNHLPFLFKFLSVRKSLSIQLHPTKEHAEYLHKTNPQEYKDDNHKPKMAIALTKVSLLYGFREDWQNVLDQYCEIPCKLNLHDLVEYLLSSYDINKVYDKILDRVGFNPITQTDELFVRLSEQYPNDTGALFALFMNVIILEPGKAISIEPNVPYAYFSGDLVECMACSDNVIRAGLTNKFKDIKALLQCISYKTGVRNENIHNPSSYYMSGFDEFDVAHLVFEDVKKITCEKSIIFVVISGIGHIDREGFEYILEPGMVFYVPSGSIFDITTIETMNVWIAGSPDGFNF